MFKYEETFKWLFVELKNVNSGRKIGNAYAKAAGYDLLDDMARLQVLEQQQDTGARKINCLPGSALLTGLVLILL